MFEIHRNYDPRLRIFYLIFGILFCVLIAMLAFRQLVKGGEYRDEEKRQSLRRILIPGPRGNIYDREGRLLVGNRPRFSAVVYLGELRPEFRSKYIEMVIEARKRSESIDRYELNIEARSKVVQGYLDLINEILDRKETVSRHEIERHFRQNLLLPFPLIADLHPDQYARLIELIPVESPIQIQTGSTRYFPYGPAACHTIGFVGSTWEVSEDGLPGANLTTLTFKGNEGRTGIEYHFDKHLQGSTGGEFWIVDPSGFQYKQTAFKLPLKGNNLSLTIDIDLQTVAEREMGTKVGGVVALDVKTGEILVLASKPNFDLNRLSPFIPNRVYREITASGAWLNRAVSGLYPPGSTFKVVTAAAGLKSGAITASTKFECHGELKVGKRNFVCRNHKERGAFSLDWALLKSCNVYFYQLGLKTGVDMISQTALSFGLNQPTGIELPNETKKMIIPDRKWKQTRRYDRWYPGDTANLSIGQGYLRVTPLQFACLTASLARGETRTQPTLIFDQARDHRAIDHGGKPIPLPSEKYRKIIEGMEQATLVGSARLARIPGLRIASKTGTPQVIVKGKTLSFGAFIAFAPVEDPQIALSVFIEATSHDDQYSGGITAAPIGKAILEAYFEKKQKRLKVAGLYSSSP